MKKLLYPLSLILTAFIILYSCSAEEDNTPPPSIIQTPEPETPAPTQYTLSVTAGEGGTVSTEGGTYDEGTEVTISATPAEGYEFVGWEGSNSESNSLTLNLGSDISINALFEEIQLNYVVTKTTIEIPNITNYRQNIINAFSGVSFAGVFTYTSENQSFLFMPGIACGQGECEGAIYTTEVPATPSLLFKKGEENWELKQVFNNATTWSVRNHQIRDDKIVIAGGSEIGLTPAQWMNKIFYGEINNETIDWTEVTSESDMAFFHDAGIGDLNQDGQFDVMAGPGRNLLDLDRLAGIDNNFNFGNDLAYNIYLKQGNDFEFINEKTIIEFPKDNEQRTDYQDDSGNFGVGYISIEINDIDSDGIDEIILSQNYTLIFKFDNSSDKYLLYWYDSHEKYGYEISGSDYIHSEDINNDNILDLIIEKPIPQSNDYVGGKSILIYLGNGDGTFQYGSKKEVPSSKLETVAFFIHDINNDNYPDLIFKAGDGYFTSDGINTNQPSNQRLRNNETGIILNELIWINNGDGSFRVFNDEIISITGITPSLIVPFFNNEKLNFIGMYPQDFLSGPDEISLRNTTRVEFYNIELNLFE
tara:strand:+ start:47 stop:1813 length:1767 start_codon:yes stop_codon:yes gene_type:complete